MRVYELYVEGISRNKFILPDNTEYTNKRYLDILKEVAKFYYIYEIIEISVYENPPAVSFSLGNKDKIVNLTIIGHPNSLEIQYHTPDEPKLFDPECIEYFNKYLSGNCERNQEVFYALLYYLYL